MIEKKIEKPVLQTDIFFFENMYVALDKGI